MRKDLASKLRDIYNKEPSNEDSDSDSSWDDSSDEDEDQGLAPIDENDDDFSEEDIPSEEDEVENVRTRMPSFTSNVSKKFSIESEPDLLMHSKTSVEKVDKPLSLHE